MDTQPAFGFKELLTCLIADMAKAISERNGETRQRQFTRSQAATAMILGFRPRDAIEAMLAGHCVMFHEVIVDSVRDTLRGELDTVRRGTRSNLVALNKSFAGNLGLLERYQLRPSEGSRDAVPLADLGAAQPGAGLDAPATGATIRSLLAGGGVLLSSLEVPAEVVQAGVRAARDVGAIIVLVPAPAGGFTPGLADLADVLTPNEVELEALGGVTGLLADRPGMRLAVTMGAAGVRLVGPEGAETQLPAYATGVVVDTTGAGDTFSGVLAAGLLEERPWGDAARRATIAAGLSVAVAGAREGMPPRAAIDAAQAAVAEG